MECGCHSLRLIAPSCARVGTSQYRPNSRGIIRKCSVGLNHLGGLPLPYHEAGNALVVEGVVWRQFVTNDGSFFVPANVRERISQEPRKDRIALFSDPQLSDSFIDPSERQKIILREVAMRLLTARLELHRAAKALFCLIPLRLACIGRTQRVV